MSLDIPPEDNFGQPVVEARPDAQERGLVPIEAPPVSALVLPAVNATAMKAAMKAYTELCEAVLEPNDYQTVQGKTFKKRSAWQKLATAFSVSTEIVQKAIHPDDDGRVQRAEFVVRATAPNGRHEDGYGACSRGERSFSKPDHDIPATAETRARNRACANLFAFGELTAEEMGVDDGNAGAGRGGSARPVPAPAGRGRGDVESSPVASTTSFGGPAGGATPRPLGRNVVRIPRPSQGSQGSDGSSLQGVHVETQDPPVAETSAAPEGDVNDAAKAELRQGLIESQMRLLRAMTRYKDTPEDELWDRASDVLVQTCVMHYQKPLHEMTRWDLERMTAKMADVVEKKLGATA